MVRNFPIIFFIALSWSLHAQTSFTLSGKVTDKETRPLGGVSVHLLNTNMGANTDMDGNFTISSVAAGTYHVAISAVGYSSVEKLAAVGEHPTAPFVIELSESLNQLDDIIVTAEKKEEDLQVIPSSISSISSKQVQEYRIWNSKDITAIVPNLYSADPGDGRNVTSIRGITSTSYDPAVATYIDGVNQFGLDTYIAQLFDVERIEVLRGPQGTLYGRNAMGGVINIITKQPSNATTGYGEVNFGTFGQQRYIAAVRTPIIKNKLFLGVSGIYDHNDGFYTNLYNNSKFDSKHSFTGNYYLKFLASEKWTLTFNLKHNQNRNDGAFPLAYQSDALATPFKLNQDAIAQMVDNIFNTSLSVSYTGNQFNFTSQTAYQSNYRYYKTPIDGDFSPIDAVTIVNNYGKKWNDVKVVTQEFKFTSPASSASPLKWTAGTYLFYQNNPVKQAVHYGRDASLLGAPDSVSAIATNKGTDAGAAIFGQATWPIANKLALTGGLRYDYEHKVLSIIGEYQMDGDTGAPLVTTPYTESRASFHAVSPKLVLAYRLSETGNLYASYSRGYRTGGITQLGSDPSQPPLLSYKPEFSNNFEVGSKNTFFDNKLRANVSFFYLNVTDAQVPRLILPEAITVTSNVGQLTSKGIELELSTALAKGLQLDFNAGLNDARYKRFKLSPTDSVPVQSGKRQVFTSPVTSIIALQYSYVLKQTNQLRIVLRGESMYLGKKYFNYDATPLAQAGYGLFNFRAGVAARGFDIMVWGRNLTNKKYIDYAYDFGVVHLGNPRNFGVTVRKNF